MTNIQELFDYDPVDGGLLFKKKTASKVIVGSSVGFKEKGRYVQTKINGVTHYVHRLVWLWHGRDIPDGMVIDHINLNKHDNRIENLRCVTASQSQCNHPIKSGNSSGHKGVSYNKSRGLWAARISYMKKNYWLGMFADIQDAVNTVTKARAEIHGNFGRIS